MTSVTRHATKNLEDRGNIPLNSLGNFPDLGSGAQEARRSDAQASDVAELQDEISDLRERLSDALERMRRAEERTDRLLHHLEWTRRLFGVSNQVLSAAQKLVMWWTWFYIFTLWDETNSQGQKVRLKMKGRESLAEGTGLSPDACGTAVQALHAVGLLERTEEIQPAPSGKKGAPPVTHIFASLTMLAWTPEALRLQPGEKGRGHGGDRSVCLNCGSEKLVKRVTIYCKSCGRDQGEPIETYINPIDPMEAELEQLAAQAARRLEAQASEHPTVQQDAVPSDVAPAAVESRPKVAVAVAPAEARPAPHGPKPTIACAICANHGERCNRWGWSPSDGEYCCMGCYSPFSWVERERARQERERGIEHVPF